MHIETIHASGFAYLEKRRIGELNKRGQNGDKSFVTLKSEINLHKLVVHQENATDLSLQASGLETKKNGESSKVKGSNQCCE